MSTSFRRGLCAVFSAALFAPIAVYAPGPALWAQSSSSSGSVVGMVVDPTGAVVPAATVTILNPVSGFTRQTTTDANGQYRFFNVPFTDYHLTATAPGFAAGTSDVVVRSSVPATAKIALAVQGAATTVTVEGNDLIQNDTQLTTDLDRDSFNKLPLESSSSSLSSLVTLASPGVAADSNGLFHGMGDHASNMFSVDGQSITDQQSKVFSNQIPSNAVQSLQVYSGAPPAEFGGKTSLVIQVTTRSGQGVTTPTGQISTSYGTFGSSTAGVDLSYGGAAWGNFVELDGLNTGRFLDPPEFAVFHDKGNEFNFFDRVDRQLGEKDALHIDLNVSRSWFQTPNAYDNLGVQNVVSGGASAHPVFATVGNTDQRSKILTYNIAPVWTHTVSPYSVFNFSIYNRRDSYNYYPSSNPLADLGPIQSQSISQNRSLDNLGGRADYSYVRGVHNAKFGITYNQTFLREHDNLGLVNPSFNSPCVDAFGNSLAGFSNPGQCAAAGAFSNAAAEGGSYNPDLRPYDLTRGGALYGYFGHTDVKELAVYAEDQLTLRNWTLNLGLREDVYNGLAKANQTEPRLGVSYTIKATNTVLRTSYARTLETPFNENLVLSSQGCGDVVLSPLLACTPGVSTTLQPGFRNEFHAGLQQAFGRYVVFSGDYVWKYTHNAFDFSVLGNTPITFPIDWHNSKIPGIALRTDLANLHGLSAFVVMSSVSARFFPPQTAGAGATVGQSGYPFRIDHDERFNQTTHLQYQLPGKFSPWYSFNWRYDSGLVAGATPCYNAIGANTGCDALQINGQPAIDLSGLTYDEQFEAGIACNGVNATPTSGFTQCLASQYTSSLLQVPAPNTENDDKNPPRIAPRNLFDMALGEDNLFHGDKYKWSATLTAINVTNKYALYNFLSTFSGTHYVSPRSFTGEVAFHF